MSDLATLPHMPNKEKVMVTGKKRRFVAWYWQPGEEAK
jgi:hypothetical protein